MIGSHTVAHYVLWAVVCLIAGYIYWLMIKWADNQKDQSS
jgi:hypothetical protein